MVGSHTHNRDKGSDRAQVGEKKKRLVGSKLLLLGVADPKSI